MPSVPTVAEVLEIEFAFDGTTTEAPTIRTPSATSSRGGRKIPLSSVRTCFRSGISISWSRFSTYLAGQEAMKAHPQGRLQPGLTLANSYEGIVEYQGLKCHKVWITTSSRSTPILVGNSA